MYNSIPHLLTPVITEPKRAFQALQYCLCEMERRYSLLNALGVRDINSYNRKVSEGGTTAEHIPYIVIVVDEFADLMATTGKELENVISRLAAMSRAIGIHLVLATQRPSVDVITGLIKANIPSRIAFMVASKMDSRIILDNIGADKLLGKGDMLFTSAWDPNPVRIQGAFLSDNEVERITDHVKTLGEPDYIDDEIFVLDDENGEFELENPGAGDPLMDAAVSIVVEAGKASASYLQRRLKIGYNRAARLVEEMEDRGIVGPANGSKPRDIIHIPDQA
jgi:S-DNA-T family DNA segregation ATPase FtsK/SpoIIIE